MKKIAEKIKALLFLSLLTSVFNVEAIAQSYPPSGTNYYHTDGANYKLIIDGSKLTFTFLDANGNKNSSFVYGFDHNDGNYAVYYLIAYDYIYNRNVPNSSSWIKVATNGSTAISYTGTTYYKGYKNLSKPSSSGRSSSSSSSTYVPSTNIQHGSGSSSSTTIQCYVCHNNKLCKVCHGTGREVKRYVQGSPVYGQCQLCRGSGQCQVCHGTGRLNR